MNGARLALTLGLLLAATGCNNPTIAELTAAYFNLPDEGTFTYVSEAGLTETHDYARDEGGEGEEEGVHFRAATKG